MTDPETPENIFEVDRVRKFIELMEQHQLTELDLKQNKQRIRLRRGPDVIAMPAAPALAPPASTSVSSRGPKSDTVRPAEDDPNIAVIKSPMVGTFYAKEKPDSPPFVKVGDHVSAEQTVCIIEAMKVFNEIAAEVSGQIVAVLVDNEESVDFGKPLFKVDTSA